MQTAVRLWALDGARLTMDRAELLDGAEPGPVTLVVPSFLIQHPGGLVLFDTGLAPEAAHDPVAAYGEIGASVSFEPRQRVDNQVRAVGFAASEITHVVVSHAHFDHTGGLRLFPDAQVLLGEGDRDAVLGSDEQGIARAEDLAPTLSFDWTFLSGDHDLFGDGRLVVLAMPGHTPGNTSLLVRLPQRPLVLSGDTAHLRPALETKAPMSADTDPPAAVESLRRLDAVSARNGAAVWVTHDPADWNRFGAPGEITEVGEPGGT